MVARRIGLAQAISFASFLVKVEREYPELSGLALKKILPFHRHGPTSVRLVFQPLVLLKQ